jgi:hypothetical protein
MGADNVLGKPTAFTVVGKRRTNTSDRKRLIPSNRKFSHEPKDSIPLLAGREDVELKYLATQGVIIALNEQVPGEETE